MGSLATFKTNYLNSTVLPSGARGQLAGPIRLIDLEVSEGATVAQALARTANARTRRIVYKAQRQASPEQAALISDFYALDAA